MPSQIHSRSEHIFCVVIRAWPLARPLRLRLDGGRVGGISSMRILGIVALAVLIGGASTAHAADCKAISDPAARLACFDSPPKAMKKNAPKPPAADEFAAAKAAMSRKLTDPESARFTDLFKSSGATPVVCGMVNSKNRMGGYGGATGFVYIPPENLAVLMFNGEADPGPASYGLKAYYSNCASDVRGDDKIRSFCH
jgi:hypothetical protein